MPDTTEMTGSATHPRPRKPRGLMRLIFRLPVYLYRARLGWLLGHRFLFLVHRGRKTGTVRETVLEVLHYDPTTRESVVFSGMGTRADWFRNIEAHPAVMVQTGRLQYAPAHRVLSRAEVTAVGEQFAREHPIETRLFVPIMRRLGWFTGEGKGARGVPPDAVLVAFRPRPHPRPLPASD